MSKFEISDYILEWCLKNCKESVTYGVDVDDSVVSMLNTLVIIKVPLVGRITKSIRKTCDDPLLRCIFAKESCGMEI
ncbi:hypothetical protein [Aquirhabdus parva]|uniref:hypothetical protein n=1 Tax=Aquirhabdus parva TaxID=2283318 RepID=UPI0013B44B14|nr:hypothetical protein [Aquirhabdus parva]